MTSLIRGFVESTMKRPQGRALEVGPHKLSYEELAAMVAALQQAIEHGEEQAQPMVAIFGERSLTVYAGILAALAAGRAYVPLHPAFPAGRTAMMFEQSEANVLIVGREALDKVPALLERAAGPVAAILPEVPRSRELASLFPDHRFIFAQDLRPSATPLSVPDVDLSDPAYLLFTSGSTGIPKGVAVSHGNVKAYLDYVGRRYGFGPEDRTAQICEVTFDLSVHEMFSAWRSGGALCVVPSSATMAPAAFIRERKITSWLSVPSVAMMMDRLRMLKPGTFPSLRVSLFCGEPLPARTASLWAKAAPNSVVDNLYGPTEATIAISYYRWREPESHGRCPQGVVPIGEMFPGQLAAIVEPDGQPVTPGGRGELLLAGTQVTRGYWKDTEKTRERYLRLPDRGDTLWYRTGDLVELDDQGQMLFCGRVDDQIKVRGHRVELQEIDTALRRACGTELAITVGWPRTTEGVTGIVGFVASEHGIDEAEILATCRESLPTFMVPQKIVALGKLPLNGAGKIDRRALEAMLDAGEV
jgi:amino acid adenylation domain-containing protein